MRVKQPTPEEEQGWKDWLAEPGREPIREVASRFDPWTLYKLKTTGQRVFILSFSEPDMTINQTIQKITCRVGISGQFNLVTFERAVFGINPDDLEECDLPGPDEPVGTMDLPIEVIKDLREKHPDGAPPSVMAVLMLKYPVKPGGADGT